MNGAAERAARERNVGIRLLPSAITVLALCAGLSAVKFALDDRIGLSMGMIGAAALLDGIDGRVARLLDATSAIGAELDSLSDAISFGVAPALVLYVTLLNGSAAGWVVALVFAVSIVLRLARFNSALGDDSVPAYQKDFFVGVPSPAGGLVALAPLAAREQWGEGWWTSLPVVAVWTVMTAALIVSRIPTLAVKRVSVQPRMAVLLLVGVALVAAVLVTNPYVLLVGAVVGYLAHIPYAVYSQRWVAARPETWDIHPSERRALRRSSPDRRRLARLGLRRAHKPRGSGGLRVAGRVRGR